jgi:site-specific recombinase XerD
MTRSTGQRRHHFKNHQPKDPAITPYDQWPTCNRSFHHGFYHWLKDGGYGPSALNTYSVAARLALGYINMPFWKIKPQEDLERVRNYLRTSQLTFHTQGEYNKGLLKLEEYLAFRQNKPGRARPINWGYHLNGLPEWLGEYLRNFVAHKRKGWKPEDQHRFSYETLSSLCPIFRWITQNQALQTISDLTPPRWFDYVEYRLANNIHPNTLNNQLFRLRAFLYFLEEAEIAVCQRMRLVEPIKIWPHLPKDVPTNHLRRLLKEIETTINSTHANQHRMGILDRAWVHLMLFSGLRTCEVRHLRLSEIQWEGRRIRILQSKGLKDRLVYLSSDTIQALQAWIDLRSANEYQSDHVFLYRNQPLSRRYCQVRLRTYAKQTGFRITPHQLRHSHATLLLNAGAPLVTVQSLLGHEKIDTTLGYARLYDGNIAADYYRAMGQVEHQLDISERQAKTVLNPGEMIALVDALGAGTLNQNQRELLFELKASLVVMAEQKIQVNTSP